MVQEKKRIIFFLIVAWVIQLRKGWHNFLMGSLSSQICLRPKVCLQTYGRQNKSIIKEESGLPVSENVPPIRKLYTISKLPIRGILKFLSFKVIKFQNTQISKNWNLGSSKFQDSGILAFPNYKILKSRNSPILSFQNLSI